MVKKVEPTSEYSPRIYPWQLEQVPTDDETHDKLIYAFQMYYKANLRWIQTGTKKTAVDARYWLSEINTLTTIRRKIILDWKKVISDKDNPERSYKSSSKKQRKAIQKLAEQQARDDKYSDEQ
jgi:hypothetical protein